MARWRSATTPPNARSDRLRWAARTICSPAPTPAASAPPQPTHSLKPPSSTASIRKPICERSSASSPTIRSIALLSCYPGTSAWPRPSAPPPDVRSRQAGEPAAVTRRLHQRTHAVCCTRARSSHWLVRCAAQRPSSARSLRHARDGSTARVSREGIGKELLLSALRHAFEKFTRIELTVHADNAPAIALYRSAGFKQEGEMQDAVLIDGQYKNALLMAIVRRSDR